MSEFSLEELARSVQQWCERHGIVPINGQAADEISERTIRYYRTLGLLDPPSGSYIKRFNEKHRLQLIAIRLFQAQGLPLRKIRDHLYGRSLDDLRSLEKEGIKGSQKSAPEFNPFMHSETWNAMPLTPDFFLVSRTNKAVPKAILDKINRALSELNPSPVTKTRIS